MGEKKNVLVRIDEEIEMALRQLDPQKKMSLSRALEHIYYALNLDGKKKPKGRGK